MTDFSNTPLGKLEEMRAIHNRTIAANTLANEAIDAEIERRKAEPDWAAWEPKRKAFNVAINSVPPNMNTAHQRQILGLIAAHNTPLAGEWTECRPIRDGEGPAGVSIETHEIETVSPETHGLWLKTHPKWLACLRYRYRPIQTDEVRP